LLVALVSLGDKLWGFHNGIFTPENGKSERSSGVLYPFSLNNNVLEIGVGTGLNLTILQGVMSWASISHNQCLPKPGKKFSCVSLVKAGRCASYSNPENYFDSGIATYVLRVSPKPYHVLQELQRVIKPRGKIVILDQFNGKSKILRIILHTNC